MIEGHEHDYRPAGVLSQQRKHVVTGEPMVRPSLVLLCSCGHIKHLWIPEPEETPERQATATQQALRQGRKPS